MCGRFTLTLEISALQMAFDLGDFTVQWQPNYNIAPTNQIPVVSNVQKNRIDLFQWGLIPSWSKEPAIGTKLINARSESITEKPSFRDAFRQRRCLIFADGFYEWKSAPGRTKTPYYFRRPDHQPFVFAGLWETWQGDGRAVPLQTCTILTCAPNGTVTPVHNRMPVILTWEEGKKWLSNDTPEQLLALLKPVEDNFLEGYPVSNLVNKPGNNSPACIERQPNQLFF